MFLKIFVVFLRWNPDGNNLLYLKISKFLFMYSIFVHSSSGMDMSGHLNSFCNSGF